MIERKDSEIGKIPAHWNIAFIGDIGNVTKLAGFEYTKYITYVEDGEITALRALNVREGQLDLSNVKKIYKKISDELPRSKLYKDDILLTYVGANIGQFALVPENDKYHLAPNICRIRCQKGCDSYFLYSYFSTYLFKNILNGFCNGSSQPTIPMANIRKIPVPNPPLPEQKAIAGVLLSLDDKIDLLNRQNNTLEAMAETLFRQWFIEEAEDDWEEYSISQIANFLNGVACQNFSPKNDIDKLPVLKIKELRNGISGDSDWASTEVEEKYHVHKGDIIFSWSASLMVKIWNGNECILNQHLFKVTSQKFPDWLVYQWCKFHLNEFILISSSHATTMGHIKRKDLDNALVSIPPIAKLEKMDTIMAQFMRKKLNIYRQIESLTNQKKLILPKLMNGEILLDI